MNILSKLRRHAKMAALAAFAIGAVSSAPVAAQEPGGSPFTCHNYAWYDAMSWYYGYAGVCYYPGGGVQYYDYQGNYW